MKKWLLYLFVPIMIGLVAVQFDANASPRKKAGSSKKSADKFEPNNSKEKAADITSMLGKQTGLLVEGSDIRWYGAVIDAKIATKKDVDWYKIALDTGKIYSICANVYNGKTLKGELDNNWGHNLLFATYADSLLLNDSLTSSPDTPNSDNVFRDAAYFYVKVFRNGKTTGQYRLEINVIAYDKIAPDTFELNNSIVAASHIVCGKKDKSIDINANFDNFGDKDYYKIEFPPKRNYKITISRTDTLAKPFVAYFGNEVDEKLGLIPAGEISTAINPDSTEKNIFILNGGGLFYIYCLLQDGEKSIFPYALRLDVEQIKK